MGILDDLDQTEIFSNSKYFQPGRYIVAINKCKLITAGHKGDSFVIEAVVQAAIPDPNHPAWYAQAHPGKVAAAAPGAGELAAHVWNATGEKRDLARSTWLGFLCAMFGIEKDDKTGKEWNDISKAVMEPNTGLQNQLSYLEVFMIKTRADNDFTKHVWFGAPSQDQLIEFGLAADETAAAG